MRVDALHLGLDGRTDGWVHQVEDGLVGIAEEEDEEREC